MRATVRPTAFDGTVSTGKEFWEKKRTDSEVATRPIDNTSLVVGELELGAGLRRLGWGGSPQSCCEGDMSGCLVGRRTKRHGG